MVVMVADYRAVHHKRLCSVCKVVEALLINSNCKCIYPKYPATRFPNNTTSSGCMNW